MSLLKVGDLVRGHFGADDNDPDQVGIVLKASEEEVSIHWPWDGCTLRYDQRWWYMLEIVNES